MDEFFVIKCTVFERFTSAPIGCRLRKGVLVDLTSVVMLSIVKVSDADRTSSKITNGNRL